MKILISRRLKVWLPLTVLYLFTLLLGFMYWYQTYTREGTLRQNSLVHVHNIMSELQRQFEETAPENNFAHAEESVSALGVYPAIKRLVVIDAAGKVLLATRYAWINQPANKVIRNFDSTSFLQLQQTKKPILNLSADKLSIKAWFPLRTHLQPGDIRPSHSGAIFMDYDLSYATAAIRQKVLQESLILWLACLLIMLAIIAMLQSMVTRPLRFLADIALRHAKGLPGAQIRYRGNGEIAGLAHAFNSMNSQIEQTLDNLKANENQLSITLNSIGDAVIATDTRGIITRMNRVAETLTGWPRDEARGRPLSEVFNIINAQTRKPASNPVNKVIREGLIVGLANDTVLIAKSRIEYQIADSAAPILDSNNEIQGVVMVFRDVTDEYALQANLKASEQRYRNLVEHSTDWIWEQNADLRYRYSSPQCYEILGYSPEEIQAMLPFDLMSTDENERLKPVLESMAKSHQPFSNLEYTQIHKTGRIVVLESSGTPIFNAAGDFLGYQGITRDITRRRKSEQALEVTRQRYRTLIDYAPEAITVLDKDSMKYVDANENAALLFGYDLEKLLTLGPVEVSPEYQPDGSLSIDLSKQQIAGLHSGGQTSFEWIHRNAQGDDIPCEVRLVKLPTNHQQLIRGSIIDIRARKRVEKKLRERETNLAITLNAIGDAVIVTDAQQRITRINPVAEKLTGWSAADALDRPVGEVFYLVDGQTGAVIKDPFAAVISSKRIVGLADDALIITRDGSKKQITDSAAPIIDEQGALLGVILVFQDVTEQYAVQQALRASNERLTAFSSAMPDVGFILDEHGRYVEVFGGNQQLLVLEAEKLKGKSLHDILPANRAEAIMNTVQTTLKTNAPQLLEYELQTPAGRIFFEGHTACMSHRSGQPREVVWLARDITHSKRLELLIKTLTSGLFGKYGKAYFETLVLAICQNMDVEIAFIGELAHDKPDYIRTLAISRQGKSIELAGYALRGTPCEDIIHNKTCLHKTNVQNAYPEDTFLAEMNIESYIGAPIISKDKTVQGLFAILDTKPITDEDTLFSLLNLLTAQIGNELLRMEYEQENKLAAYAFNTQEAIFITDPQGNILRVNKAFIEITGYTEKEAVTKTPKLLASGKQEPGFYQKMFAQLYERGFWAGEIWNRRKNGELFAVWETITAVKNDAGANTHFVSCFTDITKRKLAEKEIEHLAYFDPLTNLPNRRLFLDRLEQELAVSKRQQMYGAILFMDLDHFKTLNDALGHTVGDELLRQVGNRMIMQLRAEDTVARLGGDEFVILLKELDMNKEEAARETKLVAEKLLQTICKPYQIDRHEHFITTSIGIALFQGNNEKPDDLLKQADAAMYKAKESGRNTIRFFHPDMQAYADARLALEKDLRHSLEHDELFLVFQPQMDAVGKIIGAEVLLRWQHPDQRMISPAEFIPVAEETGLILNIGEWVLETACKKLKTLENRQLIDKFHLAVNVSPKEFHLPDFVARVKRIIKQSEINPQHLTLELTEGVLIDDFKETIKKMQALKAMGIRFSIDDFGMGYSSLAYLKQLPLDQLKIDQSFVRDITHDPNDAAIVETIISMAHLMDLEVIAEGVESEEHVRFLVGKGCGAYQGYFYSKPISFSDFTELLKNAL